MSLQDREMIDVFDALYLSRDFVFWWMEARGGRGMCSPYNCCQFEGDITNRASKYTLEV